jgi:diguanylate cyclase (GGDEF)-like protein
MSMQQVTAVDRIATPEDDGTDALTGLIHHRRFRALLEETLLPQARQSNDPLTVVLCDVDRFLEVNETYGHGFGDLLLRAVARLLGEVLPETAVVARYGGDEFAVALPDTRLDEAFTLFEEFRRRVAALSFAEHPEVQLTSSIGLAAFPSHGSTDADLTRAADQAMYLSKVSGRNKVSLPLSDSRMVTKTSYYTTTQLERLSHLARMLKRNEASLLREALDDVLKKYDDRLGAPPRG